MERDFNNISRRWIVKFKFFSNLLRKGYYRKFVQSLNLMSTDVVLELGSGTGAATKYLAAILNGGGKLICTDISEPLLIEAKKSINDNKNVTFLFGELYDLDIPEKSVDVVFIHYVLHDIEKEQRQKNIDCISRILKDDGRVIIREPLKAGHGISEDEINLLLTNAGLNLKESYINKPIRFKGEAFTGIYYK